MKKSALQTEEIWHKERGWDKYKGSYTYENITYS